MSSPQGRPIGQKHSGSSPEIRPVIVGALQNIRNVSARRRSKHKLLITVASFVFVCCAINIFRLHSHAASEDRNLLRWVSSDKINNAYDGDIIADIDDEEDSDAPTPSTTSSWPTIVPTILSTSKDNKNDMHSHADERLNNANKVQNSGKSTQNIDTKSNSAVYPIRIICLDGWEYSQVISCNFTSTQLTPKIKKDEWFPSIPLDVPEYKGSEKPDGETGENVYIETDTCKYSNSQAIAIAPPTCNDIHSLGFDGSDIFQSNRDELYPRMNIKYLVMGGAKCVWKVDSDANYIAKRTKKETFIFKSHKNSWFFKQKFYEQSQRDALISGDVGNVQLESSMIGQDILPSNWNHILPIYHYCHLASIVPFADGGNLEEWISKHDTDGSGGKHPDPIDTLRVALQAARGLYQSQMYMNGKASFVHADLNPSQFLVFTPPNSDDRKEDELPIIQINDFNQGRFLTRSIHTNETCPFRSCSKNARGNRYHSPERFQGCVDQDEGIDSFSLGSVFYYLLTGRQPHYGSRNYYKPIKEAQPLQFPKGLDLDHPAYDALIDVMKKCMTLELKDRPTSLEVVHMLEEKIKQIGAAAK